MRRTLAVALAVAMTMSFAMSAIAAAPEPDYSVWNRILATYYSPAAGMDYAALKARDAKALESLRQQLGRVHPAALTPKQQLAYWINVYNVNVVATIVENYPVDSIRDISTDPIIRLNVFKKERVPLNGTTLSLDEVENSRLREGFHDPRIHFAINCAARSCPPIRPEAYVGDRVDAQLDDQVRRFLAGPNGARFSRDDDDLTIKVTKIMDWFGEDFEKYPGGRAAFIRRYVPADRQQLITRAKEIDFDYDAYDWSLNDWKR